MGGVGTGGVEPAAVPAGCAAFVSGGAVGVAPTALGSAPGAESFEVGGSFSSAIQLLALVDNPNPLSCLHCGHHRDGWRKREQ
jgi:hypothetical protein